MCWPNILSLLCTNCWCLSLFLLKGWLLQHFVEDSYVLEWPITLKSLVVHRYYYCVCVFCYILVGDLINTLNLITTCQRIPIHSKRHLMFKWKASNIQTLNMTSKPTIAPLHQCLNSIIALENRLTQGPSYLMNRTKEGLNIQIKVDPNPSLRKLLDQISAGWYYKSWKV